MAEYHCRYESHFGQAILGYCVNIDCQQNPQFCLKCLKDQQNNHSSQCLGFDMITENLSKYIQQEKLFYEQLQEIDKTFQMLLSQSLKKIQKNLKKLQNLNEALLKGEYLKFKTEINFFRRYYSKVEETEKSEFLISLNSIVLTLQTTTKGYVKIEDQQIAQTGDNHSQYLSRAKGRFDQERKYQEALTAFNDSLLMGYNHDFVYNWKAITLNHLNKYDEAIKCFDLALQINSTYESAYNNKGALLNNLGKYEEALLYIQTAIDLNPINYLAYSNKGFALCNLQRFQEALIAYEMAIEFNNQNDKAHHNRGIYKMHNIIQELHYSNLIELKMLFKSFNTAIDLNKNNDEALENKALSLHLLQRFNKALKIYDQTIFLKKNSNRLKRKADTLLVLGRKNEAKQYYFEALRIGNLSSDQEQILYQLARL